MKHKLQRIKEESQELCSEISSDLRISKGHLEQIGDEYHRVTELSGQAAQVLDQIDLDFKVKTKLSKQDMIILFLATAIQCARQYLLTNDVLRMTDKQGDKLKKDILNAKIGNWRPVPPDAVAILTHSVPYDAVNFYSPEIKSQLGNLSLSGTTHRYRTLGHDSVLGWIFGTANIITNALTWYDFQSFAVLNKQIYGLYPGSTFGMFENAGTFVQQDPLLLPIAVARQAIHFGSDYFTKQGLPVPLVATVNNDWAKNMVVKGSIDLWSVSRGAVFARFINQLVAAIHQLFYREERDGGQPLYEVRTRKILSYSNLLATGSNVIASAITQDARKLDVSGMLMTLTRIVSDYNFIHEIKTDFLKNQLYDCIVGTEYDFTKDLLGAVHIMKGVL